jgi:GT2 family glycosyltransferase
MVNTAGGYLNFLGFSYCGGYKEPSSSFSSAKEIIVASGAGAFIPRKTFDEIGGLDEVFFMYHEDVDFLWRARLAGYKIMLIPSAKMWHKYEFSRNKKKFFYSERNRLLFLLKNYSLKMLLVILPALLLSDILMILFSIKEGWFGYKLKSYFSLFSLFPYIMRERKIIKRKVSYHKLKLLIDSEISFSEVKIPALRLYNLFNAYYWSAVKKLI